MSLFFFIRINVGWLLSITSRHIFVFFLMAPIGAIRIWILLKFDIFCCIRKITKPLLRKTKNKIWKIFSIILTFRFFCFFFESDQFPVIYGQVHILFFFLLKILLAPIGSISIKNTKNNVICIWPNIARNWSDSKKKKIHQKVQVLENILHIFFPIWWRGLSFF